MAEGPIHSDTPPGRYDLLTGLYDLRTMQRLPVAVDGSPRSDRVVLGQIAVTSR